MRRRPLPLRRRPPLVAAAEAKLVSPPPLVQPPQRQRRRYTPPSATKLLPGLVPPDGWGCLAAEQLGVDNSRTRRRRQLQRQRRRRKRSRDGRDGRAAAAVERATSPAAAPALAIAPPLLRLLFVLVGLHVLSCVACGCGCAAAATTPTDDEPHHQRQQRDFNLLRLEGYYHRRGTAADAAAQRVASAGQKQSLRRFRHNNYDTNHRGRDEAAVAAAAAAAAAASKGEAEARVRSPAAGTAADDSEQIGDGIFDHSKGEGLAQMPRNPTGDEWQEQLEEAPGASEALEAPGPGFDEDNDDKEAGGGARDGEGPQEVEQQDQLQEQTKVRQHLELSTCLSTLATFATISHDVATFGQSADTGSVGSSADVSARRPSTRPNHLITKEGILNLLSDAASTAATSPDSRSSGVAIDVQWTDLPLSLIMQYNYASCYSDAGPSSGGGGGDGICTAGGEGVTIAAVGDDAGQGEEASIFDASRRQWPRRRNGNGDKEKEEQIDVPIESRQGRGVDWPLRMLCREITSYAQELAAATSVFAGQKDHDVEAEEIEGDSLLSVELQYTFVMTNVTHSLFHSTRNGRTGPFSNVNGVVGKIRQRAMLKQRLVIATESVIRQFFVCLASGLMQEEDAMPLLEEEDDDEEEAIKTTWVHRTHKINVEEKAVKDNHERRTREKGVGAKSGATWSRRYNANINSREEAKGDAMRDSNVSKRAASLPETEPQVGNRIQCEGIGAKDLVESAFFGGSDFAAIVNVDNLQKISCQEQYSFGCVLVETSAYVRIPQGSNLGDLLSKNDGDIKTELLRAIEESIQSGVFEQLMGLSK